MTTTPPTSLRARLATLAACLMLFAAACSGTDDGTDEAAVAGDATAEADHDHNDDADHVHDEDTDHDHEDSSVSLVVGESDFLGDYVLVDEGFGTEVTVTVAAGTRTIDANALPNHDTGEFPNDGNPNEITEQSLSYEFPTEPVYTGTATFAQTPGVGLNGVSMEPGTAESATCSTGETYRVEALQDFLDLGLDMNNAHVQPGGIYHYHGLSELLVDAFDAGDDLVLVGFAADGHLMYVSASGAYDSSYALSDDLRSGTDCVHSGRDAVTVDLEGTTADGTYVSDWVFTEGSGDLDECNGTFVDGEYVYLLTDDYPYIPRCLMGEVTGGAAGPGAAAPTDSAGTTPDFTEAAAALGVTEAELLEVLPAPGEPLDDAAAALGVTVDELEEILPPPDA